MSVIVSRKPVMIPLMSNSSGSSHVMMIEVEETAETSRLVGGPLGTVREKREKAEFRNEPIFPL